MQEIINILEIKYEMLLPDRKAAKQKMNELDNEIKTIKVFLEHPEKFDNDDIDEISSMLDREDQIKLESIRMYLTLFEQFKNQPQIIKAKEIYEEIKKKIIEYFEKEYDELSTLAKDVENIATFIRDMSDQLKIYNDDTYIPATSLYSLVELLKNSDVTPAVLDFYKRVLQNNSKLIFSNQDNNISDKQIDLELNKYIERLTKINKSLTNDSLKDDELIFEFLSNMLDTNKNVGADLSLCNHVMNLLNNQTGFRYGKRLKFLIHLNHVGLDYVPEQIDFIRKLQQIYDDKIGSNHNREIVIQNTEFIDNVSSLEIFTNVDLLNAVFRTNETSPLTVLKIITGIIYQNEQKSKSNKHKIKL